MIPFIETLQTLQRRLAADPAARQPAEIEALRAKVPAPILAHFDRLVKQGKKGVAEARNGVCTGCYLRLPAAVAARGATHKDLELCENCGAYLAFPEAAAAPAEEARPRRRYRAAAVA